MDCDAWLRVRWSAATWAIRCRRIRWRRALASLAAGVFILPFFLFSATAGQLADKVVKAALARLVKLFEILIVGVTGLGFAWQSLVLLMASLFLLAAVPGATLWITLAGLLIAVLGLLAARSMLCERPMRNAAAGNLKLVLPGGLGISVFALDFAAQQFVPGAAALLAAGGSIPLLFALLAAGNGAMLLALRRIGVGG